MSSTGTEMKIAPPNSCCLDEAQHRVLRDLRGGSAVECTTCGRRYFTAEMFMDEACIQPISLRLWKEVEGEGDLPANELHSSVDLVAYIMDHKPYFALNNETGKLNAVR